MDLYPAGTLGPLGVKLLSSIVPMGDRVSDEVDHSTQDCIDAPLPCSGKSEVESLFEGPYYEWYRFNKVR